LSLKFLQIPEGIPHWLAQQPSVVFAKKTPGKEVRALQLVQLLGDLVVVQYREVKPVRFDGISEPVVIRVVNWRTGQIVHTTHICLEFSESFRLISTTHFLAVGPHAMLEKANIMLGALGSTEPLALLNFPVLQLGWLFTRATCLIPPMSTLGDVEFLPLKAPFTAQSEISVAMIHLTMKMSRHEPRVLTVVVPTSALFKLSSVWQKK